MTSTATARPDIARIVFLAGAALALSHLANEWVNAPMPWGPAWKCSGIALLGIYCAMRRAWLPALGFGFSAIGDVALELPNMIAGMAAFGMAHIFYAASFAGIMRREGVAWKAWPLAVLVVAVSIALGVWLAPGMAEKGLLGPALAYQVIISTMVVTAQLSRAPLVARIGVVIFMLSDTLIAVGLFRDVEVPIGSVWITYAAAQIMLAMGFTQKAQAAG